MTRSPIASPIAYPPDLVHIVSHGPHCLDGVTSAVAVARFHAGLEVVTAFANLNRDVESEADYNDYTFWYDTLYG